ncbi:MAG: hypothetical protein K8W52_03765 [Deltaproteobacteria bacterium]|nr:hypothetical protein [Deltaproteobacteria bacterium]
MVLVNVVDKLALLGSVLVACASCSVKDPLYCQSSADCDDPARPICDVKGEFASSDYIANTCIPRPDDCPPQVCGCSPGAFLNCTTAGAERCGADGMSAETQVCTDGCSTTAGGCLCAAGASVCADGAVSTCDASGVFGAPVACTLGCATDGARCVDIDASNGVNQALDAQVDRMDIVLSDGARFDTSSGAVVDGDGSAKAVSSVVVVQGSGPPIRAFVVRSIVLSNTTVTGANGFAIVADGEIKVIGQVSVRGTATAAAPGASQVTGCVGTGVTAGLSSQIGEYWQGAGGGGGALAGGAGGEAHASGIGPAGGSAVGMAEVVPLAGGCRGGNLLHNDGSVASRGGAGGGALQFVSRQAIRIVRDGTDIGILDVGGLGGGGNAAGGGSGGALLLEAPIVIVDGAGVGLFANGGAGAGGSCGVKGNDAIVGTQPAIGVACGANTAGGDGGTGGMAATAGANGTCGSFCNIGYKLGGGGGAVGRVRINTQTGTFAATNGGAISGSSSVGPIGTR